MRTLASRIVHRENAAFVGRTRELLIAETLFGPDAPGSVLLVHGRGGIGKSVLLREIRRRGRAAGWTPFEVDARDLAPLPDAVEEALQGAWECERPLVLLDTYERMSALGAYLRGRLLPSLPAGAVIVIAGREPPAPGWFEGGWESVTVELQLGTLSERESLDLLTRHGCDERAEAIARWSGGLPLALRLAAAAARADTGWRPGEPAAPLRRLPETGDYAEVFALACVARVVTRPLLADVLPDVDADDALRWLEGCAFSDTRAGGVTLHELVRRPYRAELWERSSELRARVALSLHARGELIDLADLVEDPAIRAGFGWDGSIDHHVTGPQPGDEAVVPRSFLERDGGHVLVARDPEGRPCGYSIAYVAGERPAVRDERLDRWLAHAPAGSIVWRDSVDLTGDPRSRVQALLNMAAILRCGIPNPRFAYLPISSRAGRAFSAAAGARHVPELDAGGVECHVLDYGPGGLLGALRDRVLREAGCEPVDVREALRSLHLPGAVAPEVRAALQDAVERAFGDTPDERLLRDVLVRGYFDPAPSHEHAARELHLSRAAYFRRLRSASERVAAFMGSSENGRCA